MVRDALRLNCSKKLSIWLSMLAGELAILKDRGLIAKTTLHPHPERPLRRSWQPISQRPNWTKRGPRLRLGRIVTALAFVFSKRSRDDCELLLGVATSLRRRQVSQLWKGSSLLLAHCACNGSLSPRPMPSRAARSKISKLITTNRNKTITQLCHPFTSAITWLLKGCHNFHNSHNSHPHPLTLIHSYLRLYSIDSASSFLALLFFFFFLYHVLTSYQFHGFFFLILIMNCYCNSIKKIS